MSEYLYEVAKRLIEFDTVSAKSNLAAMDYLSHELAAAKFKTALQTIQIAGVEQANLVAWAGPSRPDGLIVSGHMDTVPFESQPGWTRDALRLEFEGARIFGRGTSDMKGFIAECADAARRIDQARLARPLVFVFTAGEEVGCLGAEKIAPALAQFLGATPAPRLAWIGEPTSWQVSHAHKSIVLFDVTVRGACGHSGAPAAGVNAIAVMGKVLEAIGRLQEHRRAAASDKFAAIFPDAPYDVLNFGIIQGGLALNMIAEECLLRVSYRSLPDADPLEIHREITNRLRTIDAHDYASHDRSATIEIGSPMVVPPLLSPRGTALERALFAATGAKDSGGALYGTDGGWFAGSNITSLICGPGDFDQAHQPDESIGRDAFEQGTQVILDVVNRMCCGSKPL
jgi:acetylornithine deacetylase